MTITRATSPEVPEPQAGTWSNCLVAGGIAYIAGMTAGGGGETGDEYAQAKTIFTKIRHLVEAAGGSMADVMKVTIFVTDITQREKVWQAQARIFHRQFPGLDPGAGRGIGHARAQSRNRGRRPYRRQPQLKRLSCGETALSYHRRPDEGRDPLRPWIPAYAGKAKIVGVVKSINP